MNKMKIFPLPLLLTIFYLVSKTKCAKILFIAHIPAQSHFSVFETIIEGLSAREHDITVQTLFPPKVQHRKVKVMQMRPFDLMTKVKFKLEDELSLGAISRFRSYIPIAAMTCEHYVTDPITKALLSKGKQFDLVIVDELYPECAIAVASMLGKSTMYLASGRLTSWMHSPIPAPPSYVPNIMESVPTEMSFWNRMQNGLSSLAMQYFWQYELLATQQAILSKHLPEAPIFEKAHRQVAFRLTNADAVMQSPRPSMPNIAHCGGIHCRQPKPLPKDLNDFVEASGKEGFILFGLGSVTKSEMLTQEFQQTLVSVFGRLKQKVIWKFDKDLGILPKNVKILNWIPQQDLLGHPKIRLFITHAGLLSLQEALFHGVPVIVMPLFAEQPGNAVRVQELGFGEAISFLNVTEEGLYHVITKLLNGKSYKENMKKYSAIFRDQPERPVDKAVFWIEYVIRHGGANHLRSAGEDLNFFQYFLLDVVAFILLLALIAVGTLLYVLKMMIGICRGKTSKKDDIKKKK